MSAYWYPSSTFTNPCPFLQLSTKQCNWRLRFSKRGQKSAGFCRQSSMQAWPTLPMEIKVTASLGYGSFLSWWPIYVPFGGFHFTVRCRIRVATDALIRRDRQVNWASEFMGIVAFTDVLGTFQTPPWNPKLIMNCSVWLTKG